MENTTELTGNVFSNNSEDYIDPEFEEELETYLRIYDFINHTLILYLGPILFVMGNVLNTLSVIVLQR